MVGTVFSRFCAGGADSDGASGVGVAGDVTVSLGGTSGGFACGSHFWISGHGMSGKSGAGRRVGTGVRLVVDDGVVDVVDGGVDVVVGDSVRW